MSFIAFAVGLATGVMAGIIGAIAYFARKNLAGSVQLKAK